MKREIRLGLFNFILCLSLIGLPNPGRANAQQAAPEQDTSLCGSDPNQVGCWQMEEGSGMQILDGSSYGNNGTTFGNPTWVPGHTGLALSLNGSSQYAIVSDNDSLDITTNRITLSAWVRPAKLATQNIIKKTIGSATDGYELSLASSGTVFVRFNGASASRLDSSALYPYDSNTWIHVAATYDGATIKIYINGVQNSSKTVSFTIAANSTNLGIGAEPTPGNHFKGLIDDARVYDRAFSAAEILDLYSNARFICTPIDSQTGTANTGEKPMSKVWNYEDKWWSVFPDSSGTWLWRLDGIAWTPVLNLDDSNTTGRADVKPAGSPVGSVVHILLYNGSSADLASVQYNSGSYGFWSSRPDLFNISLPGSETATIDIDSTGRMWLNTQVDVTSPSLGRNIIIYYSDTPYDTWSSPITLAAGTSYGEDISLVTAIKNTSGVNTIGVLWSDQTTHKFGFKYHVDGADPEAINWSAIETPATQYGFDAGISGFADDHLNVAIASDGTLYAAIKTGYDATGFPKIALIVRRLSGPSGGGVWDTNIYGVSETGTRGIVVLDLSAGIITVIYTSLDGGGNIVYKQSATQPIVFGAEQTMRSGINNNVSSTKQNIDSELVTIYSDGTTINGSFCTTFSSRLVNLSITKTDNKTAALPGDASTYKIVASNPSPLLVSGVNVLDSFPSELMDASWICTAGSGSSCAATGSGNINDTITLAAGGSVTYLVYASISPTASGVIENTATLILPNEIIDPNPINNTATDYTAVRTGGGLCGSDAGLVACYQFDEGSGNVYLDGIQNTIYNEGTTIGNPTWVPGIEGSGIDFNGTSQYGYTADEASLDIVNQISIAAWLKPGKAETQSIINKAVNGATGGYELSLASSTSTWPQKVFFRINQVPSGDTYRVNSTTVYPTDGTWIHVAVTFDGTTMRMYINSVEQATTAAEGIAINANSIPLALGAEYNGTSASRWYQGAMDDVRVYNRALSADEVMALYTRPSTQPESPDPADDAVDVQIYPSDMFVPLAVNVNDLDSNSLTVKFYGRPYCAAPNFTVAVLPDTQYYAAELYGGNRAMFDSQTAWIVNNKDGRNIEYVTHLGDIVDNYTVISQWDIAGKQDAPKGALTALDDAEIPYGLAIGWQHDGSPDYTGNYNTYFGVSRFTDRPYYGGHYGTDNDNNYGFFSVNGLNFIVIHIENGALPAVRSWANGLLQIYPTHRAIVVTHVLLTGTTSPADFTEEGLALYNALKTNPNLFLMLGGHNDIEVSRTDTYMGHTVYSLRSDYQTRAGGGNGWMRLMEFLPSANQIQVSTYTPYLNQTEIDGDSEFNLQYDMCPFELIDTLSGVQPGPTEFVPWIGRAVSTQYEWFVTVSDGSHITSSPIWTFTTEGTPTAVNLVDFKALSNPQGIQLGWQTAQEIDLQGFNLFRADALGGEEVQINPEMIPAFNSGQLWGSDYKYLDTSVEAGKTYYYWIEWVGNSSTERFGPLTSSLAPYNTWLPMGYR